MVRARVEEIYTCCARGYMFIRSVRRDDIYGNIDVLDNHNRTLFSVRRFNGDPDE